MNLEIRLTDVDSTTWLNLEHLTDFQIFQSGALLFKLPWPHHRAQRQLKVSVQPGCRRAWFAAVFVLSRSYANQLQKFSRPHIVNLWNWEGNKYKVNRADLFHCVKVCLWPVLHSLTVPGLERLNGWTPMISTLSIPLPSSRSGIRMWYIGFCWRYKFVFTNNSWHYQRPSTLGSLLLCVWIEP